MSYQQKFQILSNELVRRMSNIQIEEIAHKEILEKIEQFIGELKNSEYSQKQSREIVTSGLRGWKTKMRKRKRQNIPFYRVAQETVDQRLQKQLTERESWYKTKETPNEDEESPRKYRRTCTRSSRSSKSWGTRRKRKGTSKEDEEHPQIKSVIFVPHTRDSLLARELRLKETEMFKVTGDRIKVVEKAGNKLEDILTRRDPWKGADCGRQNCFPCSTKNITGKDKNKDCSKRNILYEIRCLTCEDIEKEKIEETCGDDLEKKRKMEAEMKVPKYVGESGRSGYERGFEHLDQLANLNSKSHMLRHMLDRHMGKDFSEIKWGMFITKFKRSAFERQIDEAVTIETEARRNDILNSKSEWNQCSLPILVTRIGDREAEIRAFEKEMEEDKKKESEIEEKIRNLRKQRNKARLITERSNPARKRQKLDNISYISIRETWGHPPPSAPKKHKHDQKETEVVLRDENPEKKQKRNPQVHPQVHLKNVRRIPDKIFQGEQITDFEICNVDWDKVLKEPKEMWHFCLLGTVYKSGLLS